MFAFWWCESHYYDYGYGYPKSSSRILRKRMRKFNRIANVSRANSISEWEKRGTVDTTQHNVTFCIYGFLHSADTNVNKWQYPWLTLKTLISYYTHGLLTNIHNHNLICIHWVLHSLYIGDSKFQMIASYRLSINIIIILAKKVIFSKFKLNIAKAFNPLWVGYVK